MAPVPDPPASAGVLRASALRGGATLMVREGAGVLIRLAGVVLLIRLIGPRNFGLYSGAFAAITVLMLLAQFGVQVYLIRRAEEPSRELYDNAFSFLCVAGFGVGLLGFGLSLVVQEAHGGDALRPFQLMLVAVPLGIVWSPAQAKLERSLAYGKLTAIELGGDAILYAVGVPLAGAGAGVWAPVAGQIVSSAWLCGSGFALARMRPRWRWSTDASRSLARFGARYAPGVLLGRLEYVVNPLVVGTLLGATSVGYVALVLRLVDTLSFVVKTTWRLSIVVFGRVQNDSERLRRGFQEAMTLQVLAVGPVLAGFALCAPWLVPAVFGGEWRPAVDVYPFVALGALITALFNMHTGVLYVCDRTLAVTVMAALRVVLLLVVSFTLVPWLGVTGYGVAVLCASGAGIVADRRVRRLFDFGYGVAGRALALFAAPLFAPLLPSPWRYATVLTIAALAADAEARRQIVEYARLLRPTLRWSI